MATAAAILTVALAALWAAVFLSARDIDRRADEVDRNYRHQRELAGLFSLLQDAQNGARGYIVTGNDRFLEPWSRATADIDGSLERLDGLFVRSPARTAAFEQIKQLSRDLLAFLSAAIDARRQQGFEAARALVLTDEGRARMAAIRDAMAAIQEGLQADLEIDLAEQQDAQRNLVLFAGATGIVVLAVFGITLPLLYRELRQRQRTEDELRERNASLRAARAEGQATIEAASEGIVLVAPDGRVLSANHRFLELFDLPAERVVGRDLAAMETFIRGWFADPSRVLELTAGLAADTERTITADLDVVAPVPRRLQLFTTPVMGPEGEHLGRLYTLRDVTHEREVERMKSEFVAMVSHELRSPLTSIKGYVDLVLEGEGGPVTDEQREFLGVAIENADRLLALINDLLDIATIEAGHLEVRIEPFDIAAVITQVTRVLDPQRLARRQTLTVTIDEGLPAASGDPQRTAQVLTNLVSNAIKYTPPGGHIEVSARACGDVIEVAVRDDGPGFSEDEAAHAFDRFYRAQNRSTREAGGTGLGLAISRSLVELQHGTIRLESAPGQGSTFTVTLPTASDADATAAGTSDTLSRASE
jgi:signal transduction histidine kinase/CHASE3 domain sensor protein